MGFDQTAVFAGWRTLAPLDFRRLGGENTRYLRDSGSVLWPTRPNRGIMAHAHSLGTARDLAPAPRRADLRWLPSDRAAPAVVEQPFVARVSPFLVRESLHSPDNACLSEKYIIFWT